MQHNSQHPQTTTTLCHLLQQQAAECGDQTAYVFLTDDTSPAQQLTFSELDAYAQRIGAALQQRTQPGDNVLLMLPPGAEYITALFGSFYAGVTVVPVYAPFAHNIAAGWAAIQAVAASAQATLFVSTRAMLAEVQAGGADVMWMNTITLEDLSEATTHDWQMPALTADSLALLLYTSGSTGNPKGVMLTHGNLLYNMREFAEHCERSAADVLCVWLPHGHIAGIYLRLLGALLGAKTIIFPALKFLEQPSRWLRVISQYRVTLTAAPNFAYDLCTQSIADSELAGLDLSSLQLAISGGEVVRPETVEKFSARFGAYGFQSTAFHPYFGLTETLCTSVPQHGRGFRKLALSREGLRENRVIEWSGANDEADRIVFVSNGQPLGTTIVKIVNAETGTVCAPDEIGEIWAASPSHTRGYWQQPELSSEMAAAQLSAVPEQPFFRTGDLGFLAQNDLFITGRRKELIIVHGKNHYPEDIEKTASACAATAFTACTAFAIEANGEEALAMAFECRPQADSATIDAAIRDLRAAILRQHGLQVAAVVALTNELLPRTITRKIQRAACRQKLMNGEWQSVAAISAAPTTATVTNTPSMLTADANEAEVITYLLQTCAEARKQSLNNSDAARPLAELGFDSLTAVRLLGQWRNALPCEVPFAVFFDGTNINALARRIVQRSDAAAAPRIDTQAALAAVRAALPAALPPSVQGCNNVLLTGATGFLGGYLLAELLAAFSGNVYCLVRAKDEDEGQQRLANSLRKIAAWRDEFAGRLVPVLGDLSEPLFGLAERDFNALAALTDAVYHNGANVNFVAPYETLQASNVGSVIEAVRLAGSVRLKPLHFISTTAVFNAPERARFSPLRESDTLPAPDSLFSGYAQSKWVAEAVLREAAQHGIPVAIYRPGLVTGDSATGYCQTDDFLCRFVKGCLQLGAFPAVEIEIDMVAVDYVGRAIVELSRQPEALGKTFHLANPQPIRLQALAAWYRYLGYHATLLPLPEWLAKIAHDLPESNALFAVSPFLLDQLPGTKETILAMLDGKRLDFDFTNTERGLEAAGLTCPPINEALLQTYLSYFIACGFFAEVGAAQHAA